jgi:hypothetical protein
MMQFKLKKGVESFEVVDGPYAGRKFVRGKVYTDIPPEEKKKFDQIKEPAASAVKATEGKAEKKAKNG